MNDLLLSKLEERLSPIRERIDELERYPFVKGIDAIAARSAEIDDILRQIHGLAALSWEAGGVFSRAIVKTLDTLVERINSLPSVPRIEHVQLARNVLAQHPLILATDDIFHIPMLQPELKRIFLMADTKITRFDYQFPIVSSQATGLSVVGEAEKGNQTSPLSESLDSAWAEFLEIVHGRYIVAYDFPHAQLQLAVTAHQYSLSIPALVGHSFTDILLKYARVKDMIDEVKDENGFPIPDRQLCTLLADEDVTPFHPSFGSADQRAEHLLQALQAMAKGTLSLQQPLPISMLTHHPISF